MMLFKHLIISSIQTHIINIPTLQKMIGYIFYFLGILYIAIDIVIVERHE